MPSDNAHTNNNENFAEHISALIERMTLEEKIGQLCQVSGSYGHVSDHLAGAIQAGRVGSVINEVDAATVSKLQHIARTQSRLGIPLLIGRDVIHGFKTVFPIPLGQAATWSPEIIELGARIAAVEAVQSGVNWTFAPMIDISRDPRWGRIAESLGEDPYLCGQLGKAMVRGFQSDDLSRADAIAACAKHFAGYGASESGRDYCTTNIPENELRNVYLPPFKMAADAGVATFMASFSDLDGVPASGNKWLMTDILRTEWQFQGFVVSDWDSIRQLSIHGLTEDDKGAACEAANAGIDMEMVSTTYADHMVQLIDEKRVSPAQLDTMVARILNIKFALGLFEPNEQADASATLQPPLCEQHLEAAKQAAVKSCVLLQNRHQRLPLNSKALLSIAVIGPLADDGYEQLGTWIFDGDHNHSQSCLQGLRQLAPPHLTIDYVKAMETSRSKNQQGFARAVEAASQADVAIMVMGEESILSGEAHCRAELDLPGCQHQLIDQVAATGTPVVLVVMAGRPLTLEPVVDKVDAILYAWHPGTMGGPAIAELLFGQQVPSGKLPITFPRKVGQIPLYYNQKHGGKPAQQETWVHMDDFPVRAVQTSLGMTATHLDTHFSPLYEFGFGLSYSRFDYANFSTSQHQVVLGNSVEVSVDVVNQGDFDADEVVQLYTRDRVASVTRPVRELKGFERIHLAAGETRKVCFTLHTDDLAFYGRDMTLITEPGEFDVWIGGSSSCQLHLQLTVVEEN